MLLATGCGSLEKVGHSDLAWKTYTDTTYGYEISYPRDWEVKMRDPESVDDFPRPIFDFSGETTRKYDGSKSEELLRVEVNTDDTWCDEAASTRTTEIVVDGHPGYETLCFRAAESCEPEPNCWALPYGIVRHFNAISDLPSLTFISEPTTDSFLVRRMLDTLRFIDVHRQSATR